MKTIKTYKKCNDCGNVVYDGVMIRTKYKNVKNNYYCNKGCLERQSECTFKWYVDFDLVEFVQIKAKKPIFEQIDISKGFEREA